MTAPAASSPAAPSAARRLPIATQLAMLLRLLAVQGAWNYETMSGNGIGFCIEPALRLLPGGAGGDAYRAALARQARYFNSHPYMASVAVGALARAELDGVPPATIERFRTALCGPLGSVGDRLVWAAWLPFCSLIALAAFGLDVGAAGVVCIFLGVYNAGHLALRAWGLSVGWRHGLRVAAALGHPILRDGPTTIARAAALTGGFALPLALYRIIGVGRTLTGGVLVAVVLLALAIVRVRAKVEGWRMSLAVLALLVLYSVVRHG